MKSGAIFPSKLESWIASCRVGKDNVLKLQRQRVEIAKSTCCLLPFFSLHTRTLGGTKTKEDASIRHILWELYIEPVSQNGRMT